MLDEASQHEALRQVTDAALRLFRCDHASVRLCGPDGRLDVGARSGVGSELPPLPFSKGQGLLGWVAQTGQAVRVGDSRTSRASSIGASAGSRSARCSRCRYAAAIERSACSRCLRSARRLPPRRRSRGAAAGQRRGAGAARGRAAQARPDRLADAGLQPALPDPAAVRGDRARAAPRGAAQRAADGPRHFKRVNDAHGHAVGDSVLRAFADAVRACVRAVDVSCAAAAKNSC